MANVYAVKSGNWSDTTLWNTGSLPATVDDVYANTFTVYVDGNYRVLSVQNLSATSITRGGSFILNSGVSLSANVIGGGSDNVYCVRFLSAAPAFANITGNVSTSGNLVNVRQAYAVELSSTGTLTIYGSAINAYNNNSGTGVSNGYINVNAPGILNVFGDVYAGFNGTVFYGIANNNIGTINVVGNVFGKIPDSGTTGAGITNTTTGVINITGNIFGGQANSSYGINNAGSTGSVNIIGNIRGGGGGAVAYTNNYGLYNALSGLITVFGNVSGSPFSNGAPGIYNATTGRTNVVGNVQGGLANHGITGNVNTTVVNVTGNVYGGSGSNIHGIAFPYGSIATVYGDVYGGAGGSCAGLFLNNAVSYPSMSAIVIGNTYGGTGSNSSGISVGGSGTTNFVWITGNLLSNPAGGSSTSLAYSTSGTANVVGNVVSTGGGTRLSFSGFNTCTVYGNVSAGGPATNSFGAQNTGTGNLTIYGDCYGGTGTSSYGFRNTSTGTTTIYGNVYGYTNSSWGGDNNGAGFVYIYGDVYGSNIAANSDGFKNNSTGTSIIYGNVYARLGVGVSNSTTGILTVTGNVYGGTAGNAYGANNVSTGTVIISGSAIGGTGSVAYGSINNSTGILRVKRAVGNDWGLGYTTAIAANPGVFSNVQGSQTFVEELQCGSRGQWPTGGVVFFTPNAKATSMFETDTFQNYSLIQSNSADNLVLPASSVRQGTAYNVGLSTGTCIIPPVSSVAAGTLVDNLTGTATLTPQTTWNYPVTASDVNSMGGRLRNALNTNSANSLINSFNP